MNVQFRYCGAFVSGVLLQNLVDFRIVTTSSFYPVNPVDPVKVLRSVIKVCPLLLNYQQEPRVDP